jgi:putative DNA primase/helicase
MSSNGTTAAATPNLRVTRVSDVESEAVEFLWNGRLARSHVTLIAGVPGGGKSQISCDVSARITTGAAWPDGARASLGSVVMLSAEDTVKDVIRPRLEAASADLDRVHVIEAAKEPDGRERTFDLQQDIDALKHLVAKIGDVALVVIDPITSYMGKRIDSHRTTDVRSVLEPLARFADEVGVAVLAITHPPKAAQSSAINSFTGSLAFAAAARMAFIATEEPQIEHRATGPEKRRLLLAVKNNLGKKAAGLGYHFEERTVSKGIAASHVSWDSSPVTVTADEAMRNDGADSRRRADAKAFLLEYLQDGPAEADAIKAAAEREKFSARTLRRAREELGIVTRKAGFQGKWIWQLPDNVAWRRSQVSKVAAIEVKDGQAL